MRNHLDIWFDDPVSRLFPSSRVHGFSMLYTKEDLLGRQIIGVINFPPKQVSTFMSEFLVTGFVLEKGEVVLAEPERRVPNGTKLA